MVCHLSSSHPSIPARWSHETPGVSASGSNVAHMLNESLANLWHRSSAGLISSSIPFQCRIPCLFVLSYTSPCQCQLCQMPERLQCRQAGRYLCNPDYVILRSFMRINSSILYIVTSPQLTTATVAPLAQLSSCCCKSDAKHPIHAQDS